MSIGGEGNAAGERVLLPSQSWSMSNASASWLASRTTSEERLSKSTVRGGLSKTHETEIVSELVLVGGRLDADVVLLFCANWASRRAARAARSRPPRRDLAYWHGFPAEVHRLQNGRLPSHFRWRERQGRQASDERATRVCCADMIIKGSLPGYRRRDIGQTGRVGRVDACGSGLED